MDAVAYDVPVRYLCPISHTIMQNPVKFVTRNGIAITYEREYICEWIRVGKGRCAITREPLAVEDLEEDRELRDEIQAFLAEDQDRRLQIERRQQYRRFLQRRFMLNGFSEGDTIYRFICGIDLSIMADPVTAEDGQNYERRNIESYINARINEIDRRRELGEDAGEDAITVMSPITRRTMGTHLTPNDDLKEEIREFLVFRAGIPTDGVEDEGDVVENVHSLNNVFDVLDDLEDVLHSILDGWEPTNLVVMGNQSHGKSTILERLCKMPLFPRGSKRCTRLPVKVFIRRGYKQQPVTLQAWDTKRNQPVGEKQIIPIRNGEIYIRDAMDIALQGYGSGELRTNMELRIRIVSQVLPPMNLVDLPGLIPNPPQAREGAEALVRHYITEHMDSSTYLLVMKAEGGPNAADVLRHVLEHGATQHSIGVLTFCDKLDPGEPRELLRAWLTNDQDADEHVELTPHGYVATMTDPGAARDALHMQSTVEAAWFHANELDDLLEEKRAGVPALIEKIEGMQKMHVFDSFVPTTIKRLCVERMKCVLQQDALGTPIAGTDVMVQAVVLAHTLLTPCFDTAYANFSEKVLAPLHARLMATVPDIIEACERTFSATLADVRNGILTALVEQLAEMDTTWETQCEKALGDNTLPFKLQRFAGYITRLKDFCKSVAPRLKRNTVDAATEFVNRAITTTSHFVEFDFDFDSFPCPVTIRCKQKQIVGGVVATLAHGFLGPNVADLREMITEIATASFGGDNPEAEGCQAERAQLEQRLLSINDAMQRLISLAVEHAQQRNTTPPNLNEQVRDVRMDSEEDVWQEALEETLVRVYPTMSPALINADMYRCRIEGTLYIGVLSTITVQTVTGTGELSTSGGLPLCLRLTVAGAVENLPLTDNGTGTYTAQYTVHNTNAVVFDADVVPCAVTLDNLQTEFSPTALRVCQCRVETVAGCGEFRLVDGAGATAAFNQPYDVAMGPDGTVYVADGRNCCIRAVNRNPTSAHDHTNRGRGYLVTTFAGGAGDGEFQVLKGIAIGPDNTMYIAEPEIGAICVIRDNRTMERITLKLDTAKGVHMGHSQPRGVAVAPNGTVYIADEGWHCIHAITSKDVTIVAGGGGRGHLDSASPRHARFTRPSGIAVGPDGAVYISDFGTHVIRKLTPGGGVTTLAGVVDGQGYCDSLDGTKSLFDRPLGLAVSANGTVYVADSGNNRIRMVTAKGAVSTLAGCGKQTFNDSDEVLEAAFDRPKGVALGSDGAVYIADFGNHRIRAVVPDDTLPATAAT